MRHQQPAPRAALHFSLPERDLPPIVVDYLNRLRQLPVGAWADAGQALQMAEQTSGNSGRPGPVAAARATLRRVVGQMPGLAVQTQRRVQDMVEIAGACLHAETVAPMRRAALTAALALATRDAIGDKAFERLYAPFEPFIPHAELEAPGPEQVLMTVA